MLQAILFSNGEIGDSARIVTANLDGVNHIIGIFQRRTTIFHPEVGSDLRPAGVNIAIDIAEHGERFIETGAINVVQRDIHLFQCRRCHDIAEYVLGEDGAACAHKSYFNHPISPLHWFSIG
ncbi:hypothetical protein D3C80_1325910 [compost metagenome]